MKVYFSALYFVVPGYLILYYWFKLYSPKRVQRSETEILNVCKANIVGVTIFLAVLFMVNNTVDSFQIHDFSRGMVGVFCVLNTVSTLLMRALIRYLLHFVRKKDIISNISFSSDIPELPRNISTESMPILNGDMW